MVKVGRFQVIAILQAARARELGMSISKAKSWGLNRAIFYAAAKRGFKHREIPARGPEQIREEPIRQTRDVFYLGNEMAYVSKKGRRTFFTIGGECQTGLDFKRQIETRFGEAFQEAWSESMEIVKQCPNEVLLSQSAFFDQVYKPRRDELASKWTETA